MKTLFKNGKVFPISSNSFVGDVLVEDGKIKEIGAVNETDADEVVELNGKYLFPGFVDAHSHIGLYEEGVGAYYASDGNEMTDPITPHVRAIDAFNPADPAIPRALSGGITTVMILPGSANPIGGQGAILKLNPTNVDKMIVKSPAGMKMAFGENPKRVYGEQKKTPATRLGVAAVVRDFFMKVQDYMAEKALAKEEGKPFTKRDSKLEIGELVLSKKIPARIHAHRADDILTAIRIAEEFDFDFVIEHGTEGYKIVDVLREKNVKVVAGPLLTFRTKYELKDMTMKALKILIENGIIASLMCDHPVIPLEYSTVQAATALRHGSKEEDLLKMLTINPAKILGMENRIGTIEKGKDADLVIWTGHPFDMHSVVESVYIGGEKIL
ncbi:amidohydrolase [Mesoaciditoga lauensis]|uniref:amidohydrolase n=1 Tax=Mesoaciditoga lauensis TaxID=1495039 RepID=UPI00055DADBB|nr:amidohydrolase [Mesoaciditoga lauensis]